VASVDGDWVEKRYIDPAMIGMSDTSADYSDYSDGQEDDPDTFQSMGDIDKLALTIIVTSV
jgi:hypothetical protein